MTHLSIIVAIDLNGQIGRMEAAGMFHPVKMSQDSRTMKTATRQDQYNLPNQKKATFLSLAVASFFFLFSMKMTLCFFGRTDEYIKTLFVTDDRLLLQL